MGSTESEIVVPSPSWREIFLWKRECEHKMALGSFRSVWARPDGGRGRSGEAHSFLAERGSERPRAVKGAPRARAERPLTARTALREFPREGMGPPFRSQTRSDLYNW